MYRVPLLCISKLLQHIPCLSIFPSLFCFLFCLFVSSLLTSEYIGMNVIVIEVFYLSCSMTHYCTETTKHAGQSTVD